MRKIGALLIASSITWASCGGPSIPVKSDNTLVADTVVTLPPVVKDSVKDTIPTIILSTPSTKLAIEINGSTISVIEGKFAYNNSTGVKDINLAIEDGKITYLLVDGEQLINTAPKTSEPPCELLADGRIRVKHGATLSFLARYYGVTIRRLQRCNPWITDQNYIQAGETLTLQCPCKLCDD